MSEQRGLPTDEDIREGLRSFGRLMPSVEQVAAGLRSLAPAVHAATALLPKFCRHPDQRQTVDPLDASRMLVTCPDCPAEASYDRRHYSAYRMTPWLLDG